MEPGFPIWTSCSCASYASPAIDTTKFVISAGSNQGRGFRLKPLPREILRNGGAILAPVVPLLAGDPLMPKSICGKLRNHAVSLLFSAESLRACRTPPPVVIEPGVSDLRKLHLQDAQLPAKGRSFVVPLPPAADSAGKSQLPPGSLLKSGRRSAWQIPGAEFRDG